MTMYFYLRKDVFNYKDICCFSFFNNGSIFFMINIYSDDSYLASKYLKNTKANIHNVLIIASDFNIRDNNWNLSYSFHSSHNNILIKIVDFLICHIPNSETCPKHVWLQYDIKSLQFLALFVPKTPLVVWYFIMDLIPPKVCSYFALFESKSAVIFIFVHCLIISFKLHKFTRTLCEVFPSPNLNSYIVFH